MTHLFTSSTDGGLYDTRKPNWSSKALRPVFCRTFANITNTQELKATLRAGENTFPGCYPMFFITSDGAALHFDCVRENLRYVSDSIRNEQNDGWRVVAVDVNYEDNDLQCDQCSKQIESAYGDEEVCK